MLFSEDMSMYKKYRKKTIIVIKGKRIYNPNYKFWRKAKNISLTVRKS